MREGHVATLAFRTEVEKLAPSDQPANGRPPSGCTPEMLAKINAMPQVLTALSAGDLFVRGCWAVNDLPLRGESLRIETAGVVELARLAPGKPQMANHDTYSGKEALPIGRVFDSDVQVRDGATWARLWPMIPDTSWNRDLVRLIDGGAVSENSVSFGYDELMCTICETEMWQCSHIPGDTYDGKLCQGIFQGVNEFVENSFVWAGRAQGTSYFMAAGRTAGGFDVVKALDERTARLKAGQRPHALAGLFRKREAHALAHLFGARR